jgi:glutamate/tyrosine decarboxylase-like PLP-dependent enzyme
MSRMVEVISNTVDLVSYLHNLVSEHPDFEVVRDADASFYCFRYLPNGLAERQDPEVWGLLDDMNEEIVKTIHREGLGPVGTTRVDGRVAMRVSVGSQRSLLEIDTLFGAIARCGRLFKNKLLIRRETTPNMEASYV